MKIRHHSSSNTFVTHWWLHRRFVGIQREIVENRSRLSTRHVRQPMLGYGGDHDE